MKTVQKVNSARKQGIVKSQSQIRQNTDSLYKGGFNDLEHKTVYWDPLGARTPGKIGKNAVDLKEKFWEQYEPIAKEFSRLHEEQDYPFNEAVDQIAKNYDTADWNIPIFFIPEIRVSQPEKTPAADMIPRISVNSDTVNATEETDQPSPTSGLETTDDTEGSYTYADGSYTDHQYDVVGYGVASRLEDKMVLASDVLRATQSVAEQAHATGIRQYEERQILLGTEEDANGFEGMKDLGTLESTYDLAEQQDWKENLRQLITELEFQGANRGRIVVFVDFDTFSNIQNDLETEVRYNDPGEELGFGFQALEFDGVQIMKSNALPRADSISTDTDETIMVGADMGSNYMGMLQDMTVKPLAKVAPQQQFATDVYGTFVSEAPSHIQYVNATGE